jgi:hypothetical protein
VLCSAVCQGAPHAAALVFDPQVLFISVFCGDGPNKEKGARASAQRAPHLLPLSQPNPAAAAAGRHACLRFNTRGRPGGRAGGQFCSLSLFSKTATNHSLKTNPSNVTRKPACGLQMDLMKKRQV